MSLKEKTSDNPNAPESDECFEERVIAKIRQRRTIGLAKYGIGVERSDLTTLEWIRHAQEEAMDLAVYLERLQVSVSPGNAEHQKEGYAVCPECRGTQFHHSRCRTRPPLRKPDASEHSAHVLQKYRKRPVVIEAVQFDGTPGGAVAVYEVFDIPASKFIPENDFNRGRITIPTKEGVMTATAEDWIIRGLKGEYYPCKPDIFAATYESVLLSPPAGNSTAVGASPTDEAEIVKAVANDVATEYWKNHRQGYPGTVEAACIKTATLALTAIKKAKSSSTAVGASSSKAEIAEHGKRLDDTDTLDWIEDFAGHIRLKNGKTIVFTHNVRESVEHYRFFAPILETER